MCVCVFSLTALKSKPRISLVGLGTKRLTQFSADSNAAPILMAV